jgi:hypothetical protein
MGIFISSANLPTLGCHRGRFLCTCKLLSSTSASVPGVLLFFREDRLIPSISVPAILVPMWAEWLDDAG